MVSLISDRKFVLPTFQELAGQFLQFHALSWIRPIDYTVESSIRAFMTAILSGKFGNQSSYLGELALRVGTLVLNVVSLPIHLALYGVGEIIDTIGNILNQKSYCYLQGDAEEKIFLKEVSFLSWNICMLPFGIATLAGISPASERIEEVAQQILLADQDFVCLQEMQVSSAVSLWKKIKGSYAHGFTRIGPMPSNRMGGALFFASKYPVLDVKYFPLPNVGAIARGVFCVKTEAGWVLNSHLSSCEKDKLLRKEQMAAIANICEELSDNGKISCFVCIDSNIQRTGKEGDEYSSSGISNHFLDVFNEKEPFTLTAENATCTNQIGRMIRNLPLFEKREEGFERVDSIWSYKPSSKNVGIDISIVPVYDLKDPEKAISDHHILVGKIR